MTAAAYVIPAHKRDILDIRADARMLDLANRDIEPNFDDIDTSVVDTTDSENATTE